MKIHIDIFDTIDVVTEGVLDADDAYHLAIDALAEGHSVTLSATERADDLDAPFIDLFPHHLSTAENRERMDQKWYWLQDAKRDPMGLYPI